MLRFLQYGSAGAVSGRFARLVGRRGTATPSRLRQFCLACFREASLSEEKAPTKPEDAAHQAAKASVDWDIERTSGAAWEDEARWGWDAEISSRATRAGQEAVAEGEAGRAESMRCYGAGQARLIRDIFPFHPAIVDKNWLSATVIAVARQMHATQDFSAMPILADALQDAGCESEDVLRHCRVQGSHVRGCWVVDACIGNE